MKKETRKLLGKVLADGEHSGHAHRVLVPVYEGPDGTREFDGPTPITHEEHKQIQIPGGQWASAQVIEDDHLQQMRRPVQD